MIVNYRVPKRSSGGLQNMRQAGMTARERFLADWQNPEHWHLDDAGEGDTFFRFQFSFPTPDVFKNPEAENHMEPMTKPQLFELIDDIHRRIHAGDSFEGLLRWEIPEEDDELDIVARVEARYRIGSLDGQGGMRMIGVKIGN